MSTSKEVTDFATSWVFENVNAGLYDPGAEVIEAHVQQLISDAKDAGISEESLREHLADLGDYVSEALKEATDNEVERLASKDD